MLGLTVSAFYALHLLIWGYSWTTIYFRSTDLLFRWYFIWSFVLVFFLGLMHLAAWFGFGVLFWVHKKTEFLLGWLGLVLNSYRSGFRFIIKRVMYISGAYYLHSALVFDETKMPAYGWDKEYLVTGAALLLIALLFLTKKSVEIKPRGQKTNNPLNRRETLRF